MSIFRITLTGLLIATGVLICAFSLFGCLGRFWWGFELATHFRVQYAITLGGISLTLLVWQHLRWAAVFIAFAGLNAMLVASRLPLTPVEAEAQGTGPVFRALLANVNSTNRDDQRIRDTILHLDPDFVLLLEATPWLLDRLTDLADRYPQRIAAPREDNFGIALLSRRPFLHADIVPIGAAGLPSIVAEFAVGQHRFNVLGTHPLPPIGEELAHGRNDQLARLAEFARHSQQPLLLLGDLNLSPWSPYFDQLLTSSGLHDGGHGRGILPSWPAGWLPLWIPIDHALFSAGIHIRQLEIGSDIGSDHYPVIVDFQVVGS